MNIDELRDALAQLARAEPASSVDPVAAVRRTVRRARRRRRSVAAVAAGAAVLIVVAVAATTSGRGGSTQRLRTASPAIEESPPTTSSPPISKQPSIGPSPEWPVLSRPIDEKSGWLITTRRILHTSDGGATWIAADVPVPPLKEPVTSGGMSGAAADSQHAWVAAPDGPAGRVIVVFTSDGAATVEAVELTTGGHPIAASINFISATRGFLAVTSDGPPSADLYTTSDGGYTWQLVRHHAPGAVWFTDARDGWGTGDGLYTTTDGGHTWQRLHPPGWDQSGGPAPGGPGYDIIAVSGRTAVVESGYSTGMMVALHFLETNDSGVTWRDVMPPDIRGPIGGTGPHPVISMVSPGHLRVIDPKGDANAPRTLWESDNDGRTWNGKPTDLTLPDDPRDLSWLNPNTAWLLALPVNCGADPPCPLPIWATNDAGATWTSVSARLLAGSPQTPIPGEHGRAR